MSTTIAVVDVGSWPVREWPHRLHPHVARVARVFARQASVVVCPWHQVVIETCGVTVTPPFVSVAADRLTTIDAPGARESVDALWYYPVGGPAPVGDSESERAALARLTTLGARVTGSRNDVAAQLLSRAADHGAVVNAPGALSRWGRKDELEYALRWYARVSGRNLSRPETYPVSGAQLAAVVRHFESRDVPCIVKPANGARGEGLNVWWPGSAAPTAASDEPLVVQELVAQPLTVDGFKTDLRIYLLVDSDDRAASGRVGPMLVRAAGSPHASRGESAEITNTSYRKRAGRGPAIRPLDAVAGIPAQQKRAIAHVVDALADELITAVFEWAGAFESSGSDVPRRVMLWGLDVLLDCRTRRVAAKLLEINVYPQLFRGDVACDALVDRMLLEHYVPALTVAGAVLS